jgi:hypothetical protein
MTLHPLLRNSVSRERSHRIFPRARNSVLDTSLASGIVSPMGEAKLIETLSSPRGAYARPFVVPTERQTSDRYI